MVRIVEFQPLKNPKKRTVNFPLRERVLLNISYMGAQWPIISFLSLSAPIPFNTIRARVLATGRPYTVTLKIPQVSPPYW